MALLNPIAIVLATICLQWVAVGSVGSFSLKLPYVALALVILYVFTSPRKITNAVLVIRRNVFWLAPFAAFLLIIGLIQIGSPVANSAPRQTFYLIGFVALAASIASTRNLARTLRLGAAAGMAIFLGSVEYLARSIGLSWLDALREFAHGNLHFVVYSFFRAVFNAVDPLGDPMGASTKNEVAVGVLVLGLVFCSAARKHSRDMAGSAFMALSFGLLLLLNTRSVIIAAGLSLMVVMIVGTTAQPRSSVPSLLVKGGGALALAILVAGASLPTDAMFGTLGERFAFDDGSTGARFTQFREALAAIERNPLVGNGYFQVGEHVVHNMFLNAWVQGGLAAFLLSVAFYVGLLVSWLTFQWQVIKRPRSWVLPIAPQWLAPLPVMPLFRVWSSGDGGNMYLGEWIAISCFFGCWLANELQRQVVARVVRQHLWKILPKLRTALASSARARMGHPPHVSDQRFKAR